MKPIEFNPEAEEEVREAVAAMLAFESNPLLYAVLRTGGIRLCPLRRFSYSVGYLDLDRPYSSRGGRHHPSRIRILGDTSSFLTASSNEDPKSESSVLPILAVLGPIIFVLVLFGTRRSTYSFRDRYRQRRREREAEASAKLPPDPAFRFDADDEDDGLGRI